MIDDLVEMYVSGVGSGELVRSGEKRSRKRGFETERFRVVDTDGRMDAKYASNIQESIRSLSAFAHAVEIDSERAKELGIDANLALATFINEIESNRIQN